MIVKEKVIEVRKGKQEIKNGESIKRNEALYMEKDHERSNCKEILSNPLKDNLRCQSESLDDIKSLSMIPFSTKI